jgi:hypothetical protein
MAMSAVLHVFAAARKFHHGHGDRGQPENDD